MMRLRAAEPAADCRLRCFLHAILCVTLHVVLRVTLHVVLRVTLYVILQHGLSSEHGLNRFDCQGQILDRSGRDSDKPGLNSDRPGL